MKKFFGLVAAAIVGISLTAKAHALNPAELQVVTTVMAESAAGLNWKVGDKAAYNVAVGGFIKGTIKAEVTQDTGTGFWFVQEIDLMIQKQKVETLINKTNGQIEKVLINGQEQEIPKAETEILEMKEDKITVPAGSFDAIRVKIKDKKSGNVSEAWVNPKIVPMTGLLKMIGQTQLGELIEEATSFSFAQR